MTISFGKPKFAGGDSWFLGHSWYLGSRNVTFSSIVVSWSVDHHSVWLPRQLFVTFFRIGIAVDLYLILNTSCFFLIWQWLCEGCHFFSHLQTFVMSLFLAIAYCIFSRAFFSNARERPTKVPPFVWTTKKSRTSSTCWLVIVQEQIKLSALSSCLWRIEMSIEYFCVIFEN